MDTDKIKLNADLSGVINKLAFLGGSLEEKVNVSLAISLFAGKQVSLARAAELADKPLSEFMGVLKKLNIPWCEYTEEMMEADDLAVKLIVQESEG